MYKCWIVIRELILINALFWFTENIFKTFHQSFFLKKSIIFFVEINLYFPQNFINLYKHDTVYFLNFSVRSTIERYKKVSSDSTNTSTVVETNTQVYIYTHLSLSIPT